MLIFITKTKCRQATYPPSNGRRSYKESGTDNVFFAWDLAYVPLVYNLLGELGNHNSLVLTFDDFYDYLESVFKGNGMSGMLKNNILDAQYFLFIGIPFNQWFVHLFMRILRQHKERRTKFAAGRALPAEDLESCAEQYNLRFINSGIQGFLEELYQRCEQAGLVKGVNTATSNTEADSLFKQLTHWIEKNDFKRVIHQLKEVLRGVGEIGRPYLIKVIQLASRHGELQEQISLGIIRFEDQTVEMNRLRKDFLETINNLSKIWNQLNIRL